MEDALIFQVFLHLLFDRSKTGKDIAVRMNDAFRVGGGAGSEDYLDGIGFGQVIYWTRRIGG